MIKVFMAALFFLFFMQPAWADKDWKMDKVRIGTDTSPDAGERFFYIPQGTRVRGARVQGTVRGARGVNQLIIRHNGVTRFSATVQPGEDIDFALPSILLPGFHKLEFSGRPATRMAPDTREALCPIITNYPFEVEDLKLVYRNENWGTLQLTDLPDGLFNPARLEHVSGRLVMSDPQLEVSAATRLMSWLDSYRHTHWLSESQQMSAEYRLEFEQDEQLRDPVVIEVDRQVIDVYTENLDLKDPDDKDKDTVEWRGPVLTVKYRDGENLLPAMNALLNQEFRESLGGSRQSITVDPEHPEWATLRQFNTLSDFGLSNVAMRNSTVYRFFLGLPIHWYSAGKLDGTLTLRSEAEHRKDARMNVWANGRLVGSRSLEDIPPRKIEVQVPLKDTRSGAQSGISFEVETKFQNDNPCVRPRLGDIWIDSEKSPLSLSHVHKVGVMGYLTHILAVPTARVINAPEAGPAVISAMSNPVWPIVNGQALSFRVTLSDDDITDDDLNTINVFSSPERHRAFASGFDRDIPTSWLNQAVILHVDEKDRLLVIARNTDHLHRFAAKWAEVAPRMPDAVRTAAVSPDTGRVVVLERQIRPAPRSVSEPITRDYLNVGLVVSIVLFLLLLGVLWILRAKKRKV